MPEPVIDAFSELLLPPMPLPFDVFGAYWRPKSKPAICGDRYTTFALAYSLPAWPRNTKVGGALLRPIGQVTTVQVAGRQELEGGHAVVEDADQAVGLADAHDAPVVTGEVGEGTPHVQRLQRGVAGCPELALLLIWPVKFCRISMAAP